MSDLIVCPRCKCSHGLQFVKIRPGVGRGAFGRNFLVNDTVVLPEYALEDFVL